MVRRAERRLSERAGRYRADGGARGAQVSFDVAWLGDCFLSSKIM